MDIILSAKRETRQLPVHPVLVSPRHVARCGAHHLAQALRLVVLVQAELGLHAEDLPGGKQAVLGHVHGDVVKIPLEALTLQPVPQGDPLGHVPKLPDSREKGFVPSGQKCLVKRKRNMPFHLANLSK